jgi:predicted TIM-barrel fold metal-dependent hydrolase
MDLSAIRLVDQHAHNLLRPEEAAAFDYRSAFTEATDSEVVRRHAEETLFFHRSLREIAEVLECAPDLGSVLTARQRLGFEEVVGRFFAAAGLDAVLLDDGFVPERILPVQWHSRFTRAHRLLRLERQAEELIETSDRWTDFEERFRLVLREPPADVVALKSIVAYRTGLAVEQPQAAEAMECFWRLRQGARVGKSVRLACKPLNDWVVRRALDAAARTGVPVQFHTGFGDPDLDLRLANPLHLRPLLEDPSLRAVPFVLLHAAYPFSREAAYLAAVYPNAFVDFGLAVPSLSVSGMGWAVRALLELAPLSKILYASDAHYIPELFFLGARWGRQILGTELARCISNGDLAPAEAERAAEMILHGNAVRLYSLAL